MRTTKLMKEDDVQTWVSRINAAWQNATASIIETGELLNASKAVIPYGEWNVMIKTQLPFGYETARRLMSIANHPLLSNNTTWSKLPPSWRTLFELSLIEEKQLEQKIVEGEVTSDLTTRDAVALRKSLGPPVVGRAARPLAKLNAEPANENEPTHLEAPKVEEPLRLLIAALRPCSVKRRVAVIVRLIDSLGIGRDTIEGALKAA